MILIVETSYLGHRSEYLDLLTEHCIKNKLEVTFFIHPKYLETREYLKEYSFLRFISFEPKDSKMDIYKELIYIKKIINRFNVKKCLLLNFDRYFRFLPFIRLGVDYSGIYFMPFLKKDNLKRKEKLLKSFWFKMILTYKNIKELFILNDIEVVNHCNMYFETKIFKLLADPIYSKYSINDFQTSKCNDKITFAFLGDLSQRKGVYKLLNALELISEETVNKTTFIIAGESKNCKEILFDKIEKLKNEKGINFSDVNLSTISDYKFSELLSKSDIVLALHQQLEGSSGIIGKAALFHKPIIGPKVGLIADIIKEYNLGIQINTHNEEEISNAIENFSNLINSNYNFDDFVKSKSPSQFTNALLPIN